MSSHSTVLINSRSFQHAKEPSRSPVNGYFYKPNSSQNQQLLSKGAHHQLLPPALLRAVTPSSAGALAKRSGSRGRSVLHPRGFLPAKWQHPHSSSTTQLHSRSREALLDGGTAPACPTPGAQGCSLRPRSSQHPAVPSLRTALPVTLNTTAHY